MLLESRRKYQNEVREELKPAKEGIRKSEIWTWELAQ